MQDCPLQGLQIVLTGESLLEKKMSIKKKRAGRAKVHYIKVAFHCRGSWSARYTYTHNKALRRGTAVLVPTGEWYSVGMVMATEQENDVPSMITLKPILRVLEEIPA